jgi:hypothetical protein
MRIEPFGRHRILPHPIDEGIPFRFILFFLALPFRPLALVFCLFLTNTEPSVNYVQGWPAESQNKDPDSRTRGRSDANGPRSAPNFTAGTAQSVRPVQTRKQSWIMRTAFCDYGHRFSLGSPCMFGADGCNWRALQHWQLDLTLAANNMWRFSN